MTTATARRSAPDSDKKRAIMAATLRLVAHSGLHNTPMSAIAREAGVAVGTSYVYFESKEALINALYLELITDRYRAPAEAVDPSVPAREQLWQAWSRSARWHLENRDASNFIQQCEASAILTEETRARQLELQAVAMGNFVAGVGRGMIREMPVQVFHALFTGPILILAEMQSRNETEIGDDLLALTFEAIRRAVLPPES
jgi:AcrR family transcriptional regulator